MRISRPRPPLAPADDASRSLLDAQGGHLAQRWWVWPLVAYLVIRLVDAVLILVASQHAVPVSETIPGQNGTYHQHLGESAPPGYLTTATNWDGQWYWDIASHGYPSELPVTPTAGCNRTNGPSSLSTPFSCAPS